MRYEIARSKVVEFWFCTTALRDFDQLQKRGKHGPVNPVVLKQRSMPQVLIFQ